MGEDHGFVSYLLQRQQQQQEQSYINREFEKQFQDYTELRLDHIQNILSEIPSSLSSSSLSTSSSSQIANNGDVHTPTTTSSSTTIIHKGVKDGQENPYVDSSFLIGQSIRLFCDVDNTYYTGR